MTEETEDFYANGTNFRENLNRRQLGTEPFVIRDAIEAARAERRALPLFRRAQGIQRGFH
jgi:hypothetical protein